METTDSVRLSVVSLSASANGDSLGDFVIEVVSRYISIIALLSICDFFCSQTRTSFVVKPAVVTAMGRASVSIQLVNSVHVNVSVRKVSLVIDVNKLSIFHHVLTIRAPTEPRVWIRISIILSVDASMVGMNVNKMRKLNS